MFTLKLFGGAWIEGPAGPPGGRVLQRRQLSLLALLGATSGGVTTRDWLLFRLCPDMPDARARHLLSDALYVVRKELGEEAVRSHGDELRLDGQVIRCDVQRFLTRLDRGEREEALDLYGGPFLDGFRGVESQEFESWQQHRRQRLALLAAEAAGELSLSAEASGDLAAALRWERRRGEIEPYDETSVRRRLALLERLGNRGEALREYETFRSELAAAFDVAPAAETQRLVEDLRERGPAPSAGLSAEPRPPPPAPAEEGESPGRTTSSGRTGAGAPPRRSRSPARAAPDAPRRPRTGWAEAAIFAVLSALAAWLSLPGGAFGPGGGPTKAVAVLDFEDLTGSADGRAVSAGLTRHLISRLSSLDEVEVAAMGSVTGPAGPESWRQGSGEAPPVDCVVEGDVQRDGTRLRVGVRLVDVRTERNLWARVFHADVKRLFDLESAVARAVGEAVSRGPIPDRDVSLGPSSPRPR